MTESVTRKRDKNMNWRWREDGSVGFQRWQNAQQAQPLLPACFRYGDTGAGLGMAVQVQNS